MFQRGARRRVRLLNETSCCKSEPGSIDPLASSLTRCYNPAPGYTAIQSTDIRPTTRCATVLNSVHISLWWLVRASRFGSFVPHSSVPPSRIPGMYLLNGSKLVPQLCIDSARSVFPVAHAHDAFSEPISFVLFLLFRSRLCGAFSLSHLYQIMDDTLPWILTLLSLLSVLPLASSLPSIAIAHEWIPYQTDVAYYPYVVHLPDRSTRNLPPLAGLPPLLFSLSGSGARGNASMAGVLAGYDGASRKIREYNAGNTTGLPYQLAAEEFLVSHKPLESRSIC